MNDTKLFPPLLGGIILWIAATMGAAPMSAASTTDTLVAALEGGWVGEDNMTPFGTMGFATLFEWGDDASLHSRSSLNSETYIDLRFSKDTEGLWILRQEAGMEGLGVQSYSLQPVGPVGERGQERWVYAEQPAFLFIDIGVDDGTMLLDVTLRGEPHVAFKLDRQPEETWPQIKQAMLANAKLSPAEGTSIHDIVESPQECSADDTAEPTSAPAPEDPIASARRMAAASPSDAQTQLGLARALGTAINANPANGPRYAFEMLESLTTAIKLDPRLSEAYHWLVGYYLNAPPIAGGSVDKASEVAGQLAEFDPSGAEELLAQVEAHRMASN